MENVEILKATRMQAPLPWDEAARLEALQQYHVLDTPREKEFDDLVWLAAHICETPIALVSLVDRERLWFKGRYGLEVEEVPRHCSFCERVLPVAPEMMVVPDASLDERFAPNELVRGPMHIRFYAGAPLVTPEGHTVGTLCVLDRQPRVLTDRQQEALRMLSRQVITQLELRRRLAELSRTSTALAEANSELEGFSHAVSHDLRGPLRAATSYAAILRGRCADQLDARSIELLREIEHNNERTADILDGFLRLMQLKKHRLDQAAIDMQGLVESVIRDLTKEMSALGARFEVSPLPPAWGDSGLMRQAWVNLISNALKFSRNCAPPVIKIGARELPDAMLYFVEDNGVGFKAEEAERLWTAFGRLAGKEFEGTGLGLSIVHRIVSRHGGEVCADAAPGKGAAFYFTLPKRVSGAAPAQEQAEERKAA